MTITMIFCPQCGSDDIGGNGDNTNTCFACSAGFHDTGAVHKQVKKFTVYYEFQGTGYVDVEANSESEASDKFHSGEWSGDDHEQGENYEVTKVEEKKI